MARYSGPVCRLCRREGAKLFLKGERCMTVKCAFGRRSFAPGMAGQRRRKTSEYGLQLREKQKARRIYGVLERQFRKAFEAAEQDPGLTGENLLRRLELRLDNVVYRLGFADSRSQARQLVRHGHFVVGGRKLDVPSATVRPGTVVEVAPRSKELEYFKGAAEVLGQRPLPDWLSLDVATMSGRVLMAPSRESIDTSLNEQLIVEFYSR